MFCSYQHKHPNLKSTQERQWWKWALKPIPSKGKHLVLKRGHTFVNPHLLYYFWIVLRHVWLFVLCKYDISSFVNMASCKTKILLFGWTRSENSTIANMMIKRNLNSMLLFETNSRIRRKTISFPKKENDEYTVVDTMGFEEAQQGIMSNVEARNWLHDFFTKINETG